MVKPSRHIPATWRKWLEDESVHLLRRSKRNTTAIILLFGIMLWFVLNPIANSAGSAGSLILAYNASAIPAMQLLPNATIENSQSHSPKEIQKQRIIPVSDLPDASDWTPTEETPYEVCFVTSVFGASEKVSDRPPDVKSMRDANPSFQFFAFTNLLELDAPGWTLIFPTNMTQYRRFITQSRWGKFMAWRHPQVYECQAVFYMDGFCGPKLKHSDRYKRLAKAIHESEIGLFQNQHDVARGPLGELDRIVERNKDISKNVMASKAWLLAQPDFRPNATLYANHYIGYDPKNPKFQMAAEFFWSRYSLEEDSWRDQPLWSYVLDRYHITPTRLGTFDALFKEHYKRMGHAGHRYDEKADHDAAPKGHPQ